MQDNLGGLERTSLPNTTAGTTNTRSAAEIDEEYNLHVSLLGLAVMPSNDDNHDGRHHQHGHDDYNKAGEEDEDEDEDDDEEMEEVSPRASSHKTNNLERFLYMFKATNKIKSLRIDSFGTFSIPAGLELQFIGQYQPIPDGLKSSFTMFGEHWTSQINYVAVDGGDTALQFSVCNLRTMKTTSLVETRDELDRVERRNRPHCLD
ncbi:hypothetical protein BASA81_000691 [Batrachochytrium salamandrivorans]|nr:hypothetical protein BASA81_000691 [Batrachochytrium salamandrivorans]